MNHVTASMSISPAFPARPATVLVVDDEPSVRLIARRMLECDGCTVFEAADGLAALAFLAEHGPVDMVVADLRMPNMDGRALAACLASQCPRVPILFISGFERHPGDVTALAPVLSKPFSAEQLCGGVRQLLARQAQSA
jgi:CheY-like chemotaxis protein